MHRCDGGPSPKFSTLEIGVVRGAEPAGSSARFCGQSSPPQDDSGTSKPSRRGSGRSFRSALQGVVPPGNDNTAANSRVAVLSEMAALLQDRHHDHLCRGGGVECGGGLAPRPPAPPPLSWRRSLAAAWSAAPSQCYCS